MAFNISCVIIVDSQTLTSIGGGRGQWLGGGTMASAEHEPITEVCGQSPQQGPGAEPQAESIFVTGCPTEPANLAPFHFRYK